MSNELAIRHGISIPPCTPKELAKMDMLIEVLHDINPGASTKDVPTEHFCHAGCYVRTCLFPKGIVCAAVKIIVPTVVIICGKGTVFCGDKKTYVDGYYVMRGEAPRQMAFLAEEDTYATMFYATDKTDPVACEEEFTDQTDLLLTRR